MSKRKEHSLTADDLNADARPPDKTARARNEGCEFLATQHPHPADQEATFDEPTHTYTVKGQVPQRSVTGLVHHAGLFEEFNPTLCVETYYFSWKSRGNHPKYGKFIDASNGDDDKAKAAILKSWEDAGKEASALGTALHLYCEQVLNRDPVDENEVPAVPDQRVVKEASQIDAFLASEFGKTLTPYRTELTVFLEREGIIVCAGQIDALMRDAKGNFYIFDWKRVKPEHRIDKYEPGFRGRCGKGVVAHMPDTKHSQYSLQTSIYAHLLRSSHGIDVGDRMYLVRVHDGLDTYELVKCTDLRDEAEDILDDEFNRLKRAQHRGPSV